VDVDRTHGEFADRGVVRLDRAFSADAAARMRDAVWRYAQRKVGISPDDRTSWPAGWLPVSWKGLKRNHVFDALIDNPSVLTVLDRIFAPTGWQRPKPGAQVLFNLPAPGPWAMHHGWHMDCGFERPTWPTHTVKLFAFFGDVGPCGGGTMLLAGSHRLVDLYRSGFEVPPGAGSANWHRFLRRYPPLGDLLRGATLPDLGRSMVGERYDIEGIPIEVVELTGRPGDVVVTHLHVFHCASPNTSDTPRQMLGKAVAAA
jgi:ectoine hydroxylase-related dioxygenase (phytanoyl-CoA dioxygenase family)